MEQPQTVLGYLRKHASEDVVAEFLELPLADRLVLAAWARAEMTARGIPAKEVEG